MSVKNDLAQEAIRIVTDMQQGIGQLKAEIAQLEDRKSQIQSQLVAAVVCRERLSRFQPEIGGVFQCPSCWIRNELRSPLKAIGGGTNAEDFLQCSVCRQEITIDA